DRNVTGVQTCALPISWNVSGESSINAICGGMAIALFSYLGVETASVAAAKVRNPDRNIPRATILGTIATAVVYLLSLTVAFGVEIGRASCRERVEMCV